MKLDALNPIEWLQMDQEWLHEARVAVASFRDGQRVARESAEARAAM